MKHIVVYVHGKGGSPAEAEHYKSLFPDSEVIGFDYRAQTPWEAKEEFPPFFAALRQRCGSLTLIANSIGAFFSLSALDETLVDAAYLKDSAAAQKFHQRVGFVFQNADAQLFCATVGEEVAFGPAQMGLPADELERRVRDAMGLFQVADLADASPYQLSGGQKKRVALAAVVSMNPDILVLDEPTNGLDEDSCDIVVNFLLAYVAAGKTVLMSTHHQDLMRRLGARAIYIDRYHHVVEVPSPSYGTESGVTD